ncbi:hypothetical protein KG089_06665 [Carnobacteriaceae bacterium zg-ZUI252]|nr:hypothetical protein [Carnobacteriaceae bacterium zg-ZUI252]MBS4770768.1 hypothetical protein [Carnobacteriaceae bacterium zg-ZUI240]
MKSLVEKMKAHKVWVSVFAILFVLVSGIIVWLNQPNQAVTKKEIMTTTQSTTKQKTNAVVSELENKLSNEVTAETNVAELESKLSQVTDEKVRNDLSQRINVLKEQVAVKVEEKKQSETQAQPTVQNTVQKSVVADEQPAPKPQPTDTPSPASKSTQQPVQTQRPVVTTQRTTQKVVATTQNPPTLTVIDVEGEPIPAGVYRITPLGNSGMEFRTEKEAYDWGDERLGKIEGKTGYWTEPVFYSDGNVYRYTVDWY